MRRNAFMGLVVALITTLFTLAGFEPANAANSAFTVDCVNSVVDTPDGITVKGCVYTEAKADAKVKSHTRALVNGATQVSWMNPTKISGRITPKSVKRSPLIKVTMKTTSKSLWRKSHGAKVVRIVGDWRNMGRLGHITGGFKAHASWPGAIMVWNGKSHKYEHGASLWLDTTTNRDRANKEHRFIYGTVAFGGKRYIIVDSCDNDLAGTYDVWIPGPVIQVHSEDEVIEDASMEGTSSGMVELSGTKSCPAGDISWRMTLSAASMASVDVQLTQRVIADMSGPGWAEAEADAIAKARGKASGLSIAELSVKCSGVPPTYTAPTVTAHAEACVAPGGTTNVVLNGINPNNVAASGSSFVLGSRVKDLGTVAANGTPTWTFTGVGVGTYPVGFTLGAPINLTGTTTVTVEACPPPVNNPPTGRITNLPHQYASPTGSIVGYVYWLIRDADGDTVDWSNFRVINSNGATAHAGNVLPSSVMENGTACPADAKCFRGEIWSGTTTGNVSASVDISDGKSTFPLVSDSWPVLPDDRG